MGGLLVLFLANAYTDINKHAISPMVVPRALPISLHSSMLSCTICSNQHLNELMHIWPYNYLTSHTGDHSTTCPAICEEHAKSDCRTAKRMSLHSCHPSHYLHQAAWNIAFTLMLHIATPLTPSPNTTILRVTYDTWRSNLTKAKIRQRARGTYYPYLRTLQGLNNTL